MDINLIDIIIILVLVAGVINGFRKGVISQLGGILGLIVGVWLAFRFGSRVSEWVGVPMNDLVAYIVVFVAGVAASWLATRLVEALLRSVGLGFLNRLGGAFVSLIFSSLMLSLAIGFFEKCNNLLHMVEPEVLEASELTDYVMGLSDVVFPYLEQAKDAIVDEVEGVVPQSLPQPAPQAEPITQTTNQEI